MHSFTLPFILILVVLLTFLTYYLELRKKNSTWAGTLENKIISDYFYKGYHSSVYILYVIKDDGEKLTFDVDEIVYQNIDVGDRVTKVKGSYYPTRF
jgi:hypothetical protein